MQALSTVQPGENYEIKWMFGVPESLDFLRLHQMKEGSRIRVIQRSAGGLIVGTEGYRLALSNDIADRIQV